MGCINSKHVIKSCNSPIRDPSLIIRNYNDDDARSSISSISSASSSSSHSSNSSNSSLTSRRPKNHHHHHHHRHTHTHSFEPLERIKEETEDDKTSDGSVGGSHKAQKNVNENSNSSNNKHSKKFGISIKFKKSVEDEQVASGWPAWLSSGAGDAFDGWQPLKSDNFERMEKIGQGTYSNVYRARDLQSGKIVALKKVRFDNFQPESVRFMAREIKILRRLDHPNVMKLEGIITSRLSCSVYLVFEYMEHDLAGLLSCPDVKFTDPQIKCLMSQLLKGVEHCHSRGIIHRDIKSSNVLVNNEGVLKIADFGLANFYSSRNKQPLTSRVVTLWYRPPELLLGSTNYSTYVDMWSVGCVFAELFIGRPILKGRTEVEQLHKIFKLCGTPRDEYWERSQLPLAAMFRPQYEYESTLRERCRELPRTVIDLIESLLSVEPQKRATAKSALKAEYFHTRPYACDPSSMPKYPPNKEMDAKYREVSRRRRAGGRVRTYGGSRMKKVHKLLPDQPVFVKLIPESGRRSNVGSTFFLRDSVDSSASFDTVSDISQTTDVSQSDSVCTLPAQALGSNGSFMWAGSGRNIEEFTLTRDPHHTRHALQMRQSLMKSDSFDSTEIYEPKGLSSDHHEQERFRHSESLPIQSSRSRYSRVAELY